MLVSRVLHDAPRLFAIDRRGIARAAGVFCPNPGECGAFQATWNGSGLGIVAKSPSGHAPLIPCAASTSEPMLALSFPGGSNAMRSNAK